jgi:hypothetical protein
MVSCQEPSPLKGSKHSQQCHPYDAAGECTFLCVHGGGGKVSPLPQCCTLPAHEEATLPLSLLPSPWRFPLQPSLTSLLPMPTSLPSPLPSPSPSLLPIAVSHCRCGCRRPLPLPSLSRCCQPRRCCCTFHWPLPSPSSSAIAVIISAGHHRCRCCCCRPFLRVVALAQQELYLNNLSKECLP